MSSLKEESSSRCYKGCQKVFSHQSEELKCPMKFGVYIPDQAETEKVPAIFWLSGLTCTEQNFITKSGAQRHASDHGFIVISPDTSPRGCNIEGEDESYDFGSGAGFYLDATEPKWKNSYRMDSYVTKELMKLVLESFNILHDKLGIMGHSMGGHGALICHLRNPFMFKSVSAFAPICNPSEGPWGKKAFTGYLGAENKESWKEYDATELAKTYEGPLVDILIEQGKEDIYLAEELLPNNFVAACRKTGVPVVLRIQEGYDHSYYFVQTFLADHFDHHAKQFGN